MGAEESDVGAMLRAGEVCGVKFGVGRGVCTRGCWEGARGLSLLGLWRDGGDVVGNNSVLRPEEVSRDEGGNSVKSVKEARLSSTGGAVSDESVRGGVARWGSNCLGKSNPRSTSPMPTTSGGLSLRFLPPTLKLLSLLEFSDAVFDGLG